MGAWVEAGGAAVQRLIDSLAWEYFIHAAILRMHCRSTSGSHCCRTAISHAYALAQPASNSPRIYAIILFFTQNSMGVPDFRLFFRAHRLMPKRNGTAMNQASNRWVSCRSLKPQSPRASSSERSRLDRVAVRPGAVLRRPHKFARQRPPLKSSRREAQELSCSTVDFAASRSSYSM